MTLDIIQTPTSSIVTTAEIIDRLQQATTDLLWSSESDYPFEIVTWDRDVEMTPNRLFSEATAANIAIESIPLIDFFAPVLTIEGWYGVEELEQVDRYTELLNSIESNLSEVTVFRIGEIEIAIYIVGKTPDGDIVGVKTHVVET